MALNMLSLKTTVGLSKLARPAAVRVAQYSWEPKEVETHTGQVSRFADGRRLMTLSYKLENHYTGGYLFDVFFLGCGV